MKKNNKGFTLVELIVVLVILAILAAILTPALLGYIDSAKSEKDYSTAQTIRVAAQAEIDQMYGDSTTLSIKTFYGKLTLATATYGPKVIELAGVDSAKIKDFEFAYKQGIISEGFVQIDNAYYQLTTDGQWKPVTTKPTIATPTAP